MREVKFSFVKSYRTDYWYLDNVRYEGSDFDYRGVLSSIELKCGDEEGLLVM